MSNLAWHFVRSVNGVPTLRDGRPVPPVGEWLEEPGDIVMCQRGLHASWRAFDALGYVSWEGAIACLVEVEDIAAEQKDKLVCRRRRVVAMVECDDVLRLFAREAALSVLHLWEGEVPAVVREYLETGNEEIGDAARAAAWDAARAAAWAAARDAARAAARDAARDAAISGLNATLESMLLAAMEYTP